MSFEGVNSIDDTLILKLVRQQFGQQFIQMCVELPKLGIWGANSPH
ncbi:MAG: hypothetical protein M3Q77_05170 [Thermoproteota archaeon]|nr:hypothetical protein [Thermoproteota archaeon]